MLNLTTTTRVSEGIKENNVYRSAGTVPSTEQVPKKRQPLLQNATSSMGSLMKTNKKRRTRKDGEDMEMRRKRINFHSKLRSLDLKPSVFHVFSL